MFQLVVGHCSVSVPPKVSAHHGRRLPAPVPERVTAGQLGMQKAARATNGFASGLGGCRKIPVQPPVQPTYFKHSR